MPTVHHTEHPEIVHHTEHPPPPPLPLPIYMKS